MDILEKLLFCLSSEFKEKVIYSFETIKGLWKKRCKLNGVYILLYKYKSKRIQQKKLLLGFHYVTELCKAIYIISLS